jgi:hypothetical protein
MDNFIHHADAGQQVARFERLEHGAKADGKIGDERQGFSRISNAARVECT